MDLVGKWVLLDGILHGSVVQKTPWLVTDQKGMRVYLERINKYDEKEEKYVQRKSIKAVFSSKESAQKAGERCIELSNEWWSVLQNKYKDEQVQSITNLGGIIVKNKG